MFLPRAVYPIIVFALWCACLMIMQRHDQSAIRGIIHSWTLVATLSAGVCSVVMHIPVDQGLGLLRLNAPAVDAVDEEEDIGGRDGTTLEEQMEDEASPLLDPLILQLPICKL